MDAGRFVSISATALLLLTVTTGALAQTGDEGATVATLKDGIVASLGFGAGTRGMGGQISLWGNRGRQILGLRTAGVVGESIFLTLPSDSGRDVALLYGRRSGPGKIWSQFGIGPAYVRTVRGGCWLGVLCTHDISRSSTVGLAVQADAVLALFGPVGLAATGFANLNGDASFGGLTIGVAIGGVGS